MSAAAAAFVEGRDLILGHDLLKAGEQRATFRNREPKVSDGRPVDGSPYRSDLYELACPLLLYVDGPLQMHVGLRRLPLQRTRLHRPRSTPPVFIHSQLFRSSKPNYLQIAITCRRERIEYLALPIRESAQLLPALRPFLGRREIVLCLSSPRNPFGYRFDNSALRELLTAKPAPYVVLDEVYGDLDPVPRVELAGDFPNLLLVRSHSKAWALADVRVGFLIRSRAPEGFAVSHMLRNHLGGLQQAIGLAVLERDDAIRWSFREIRALRYWFSAEVSAAGYRVWPSEAGFVCLETKESDALGRRLEKRGIRVAQLHGLPGYPQDWPAGLRVAMAPKPALQEVVEVLARANAAR